MKTSKSRPTADNDGLIKQALEYLDEARYELTKGDNWQTRSALDGVVKLIDKIEKQAKGKSTSKPFPAKWGGKPCARCGAPIAKGEMVQFKEGVLVHPGCVKPQPEHDTERTERKRAAQESDRLDAERAAEAKAARDHRATPPATGGSLESIRARFSKSAS